MMAYSLYSNRECEKQQNWVHRYREPIEGCQVIVGEMTEGSQTIQHPGHK